VCKYGLLYLVASAIAVLCAQLHFVDCFNKRKKKKRSHRFLPIANNSRGSKPTKADHRANSSPLN